MPASYAISVRRAGVLPAASFRFRVTPDTLAVRLTVPTIRVRRGLTPPSHKSATIADSMGLTPHAPCRAHYEKKGGRLAASLFFLLQFPVLIKGPARPRFPPGLPAGPP